MHLAEKWKRYSVPLQLVFVFAMLSNLVDTGLSFAVCLVCGLLCVENLRKEPRIPGRLAVLGHMASAGLSAAVIYGNLAAFEPLRSLISLLNIGCTFLGGWVVVWNLGKGFSLGRKDITIRLQSLLMICWVLVLQGTDSRLSVYLLCALAGTVCLWANQGNPVAVPAKTARWLGSFAGLFAAASLLANYPLFLPLMSGKSLALLAVGFLGGVTVGWNVLLRLFTQTPSLGARETRNHPLRVFFLAAGVVAVIDLLALFFYLYPGILTKDSTRAIAQIMGTKPYDNIMPFWHTVTVQVFVKLGLTLFGDMSAAVALFHCAQILLLAASVGAVIVTLYQIGVPRIALGAVFCLYAFQPYNIVYSVTLWKDVPFGCSAVLFAVGLFRLLKAVGRSQKLNYAVFLIGAVGFSLFRTNGWYAFLAVCVVMLFLLGKKRKKLLILMVTVLLLCWCLLNPVLEALGVKETDLVEAFGVPMQQVARVVANGRELTPEQEALLSQVFDLEKVAELYNPASVDPVKFQALYRDQRHLLLDNGGDYLRLYLALGMKYPGDYLQAWVEETKGFWNSGYEYWMYTLKTMEKENGIVQTEGQNIIAGLFRSAFRLMEEPEMMKVFSSIGLYVWCLIGCCVVLVLQRREEFLLCIPVLVLMVGLWLGTPVFCEFRYAYPLMLTMPLIGCVTLFGMQKKAAG